MAARSITTRIALEGSDDIRRALETLGKSGADAFDKIKQSGDKLNFDATGKSAQNLSQNLAQAGETGARAGQQISESFAQTAQQIDAADGSGSRFALSFGTIAAGIAVAVAGIGVAVSRAIAGMTATAATANEKLQDAATKAGLTAQGYERFANRIETAGGNTDQVVGVLQRLGQVTATATEAANKHSQTIASSGPIITAYGRQFQKVGEGVTAYWQELEKSNVVSTKAVSSYDVMTASGEKATVKVIRFGEEVRSLSEKLTGQAAILQKIGIDYRDFATANDSAKLNQLRQAFANVGDELQQQRLAAQLFGADWRNMLAVVRATRKDVSEADAALKESGRQLSKEQRQNLTDYTAAAVDLQKALSATKEQIGAIFAPGATKRAEWLTELLDESRKWLLQLAEIKTKQIDTFFADRGGKAFIVEVLKSARDFAVDFGSVVTTLVIPALRGLAAGFDFIAAKINETFGTTVSGRFIAIAVGVGVLTGAFGLLGVALAPIIAVVGGIVAAFGGLGRVLLVGGVGARTFWTDLQAGGRTALGFFKAELPNIQRAFAALFKGDFKTAWAEFGSLGSRAFTAIKDGLFGVEGVFAGLGQKIRSTFTVVMAALNGFAAVINATFGTNLTGSTLGFNLLLLQMSGIFGALIPIISGALLIFSKLGGSFFLIGAAVIVLARMFPDLGKSWREVMTAFDNLLRGDFSNALIHLRAAFDGFWTNLQKQGTGTWIILGLGATALASRILGLFGVSALGSGLFGGIALAFKGVTLLIAAMARGLVLAIEAAFVFGPEIWAGLVAGARVAATAIAFFFTPAGAIYLAAAALGAALALLWVKYGDDVKAVLTRVAENIDSVLEKLGLIKRGAAEAADALKAEQNQSGIVLDPTLRAPTGASAFLAPTWIAPALEAWKAFMAVITSGSAKIDETSGKVGELNNQFVLSNKSADEWNATLRGTADAANQAGAAVSAIKPLQPGIGETTADFNKRLEEAGQTATSVGGVWDRAIKAIGSGLSTLWKEVGVGSAGAAEATERNLSGAVAQDPFAPLQTQATTAFAAIRNEALILAQQIAEGMAAVPTAIQEIFDALVANIQTAMGAIAGSVDQMVAQVSASLATLAQQIADVAAAAASVGGGSGLGGGDGNVTPAFASGGYIRGPGTGTSDSILARLSNGEFVIRAAAVRLFGPDFFKRLNALQMPKFAAGGLVNALAMPSMSLGAFSGSGLGAHTSLAPVNLTIGGETFAGLLAPDDVVGKLATFANRSKMRAAGKKPSWFGG